jgi:hypothetical protein
MRERSRFESIAFFAAFFALLAGVHCGDVAYVELQIADDRLPFLIPGSDFDGLAVDAKADGCGDANVRYPPQALPATLTVVPGDCMKGAIRLQASASLGERRVAESAWLELVFPSSGGIVATATLTQLPGPRVRFRTGFEPNDPIGGPEDSLFVVRQQDVVELVARVDETIAVQGARSIRVAGTATSTNAHAIVRAATTDVRIAAGDRLVYAIRGEMSEASLTIGVDLQLDSGETAAELGLIDVSGLPIHPASQEGRVAGAWQRFVVDLTPAAGRLLVGLLFGFDARQGGRPGRFDAHLDDVTIEAP